MLELDLPHLDAEHGVASTTRSRHPARMTL